MSGCHFVRVGVLLHVAQLSFASPGWDSGAFWVYFGERAKNRSQVVRTFGPDNLGPVFVVRLRMRLQPKSAQNQPRTIPRVRGYDFELYET